MQMRNGSMPPEGGPRPAHGAPRPRRRHSFGHAWNRLMMLVGYLATAYLAARGAVWLLVRLAAFKVD